MGRRQPWIIRVACTYPGCTVTSRYEYETQRELRQATVRPDVWRCAKHGNIDAWLRPGNEERTVRLTCGTIPRCGDVHFWGEQSGYLYGPGFHAAAEDWPVGAVLVVTARVELPAAKEG